jgi:branched-chain amino acid transport system substrate-binding protein
LRLFATISATGALAPALSSCAADGVDDDHLNAPAAPVGERLRIGLMVPRSGPEKPYGDDLINGLQLRLRLANNVLGRHPVLLTIVDEGESPQAAVAAADRLIKQDRVHVLTGVVSSSMLLALRDKVETSQVPMIGSFASPAGLASAKYIWRATYGPTDASEALGRYVARSVNGTVAVVAADQPDDDQEVKTFVRTFTESRGRVEGQPVLTPAAGTQFGAVLAQVKASPAAGMFCYFTGAQTVEFVKQFKAAGFRPGFKLFAPGALTEGYALQQQGDAARDIYTAMNYAPDLDNAENRRFVAEYQKAYNAVPSTYAVASYDVGTILDKAVASIANQLTSVELNAAIGRLGQIDSPRGPWQFNQNRLPLQRWYLRQVRPDGTTLSNVLTAELTTLG